MEVASPEVDHALASRVLNVGVTDVPFLRDRPVEHLGATRDFVQFKRDSALKQAQTLADAIASNASADWIKSLNDGVSLPALLLSVDGFKRVAQNASRGLSVVRCLVHQQTSSIICVLFLDLFGVASGGAKLM